MDRWRELLPNSDVVANLGYLQQEALSLRRQLLSPWSAYGLDNQELDSGFIEHGKIEHLKAFRTRVDEREVTLGAARVTRILLINVPPLREMAALQDRPTGEPEAWISRVLVNIELELCAITSRRMLATSLISAVVAVVAAVVTAGALLFDVVSAAVRYAAHQSITGSAVARSR
ncbi:MAG TPA: hypothetical protein VK993_02355 [Chthoniobacterales bacterium]|nr:hypothetical protein [Chthoniobacterales bacterium]